MDNQRFSNPFDEDEKSGGRPLAWIILGVAALGCGILFAAAFFFFQPDAKSLVARYFPSPTPTSTRTRTPTPTATPTQTQTPTPTPNLTSTQIAKQATDTSIAYQTTGTQVAADWKIILADSFDSNKNNWLVKTSDDEYAKTIYSIEDGKYRWESTAHKGFIGWVRTNAKSYADFYLSVEARQVTGPNSADYGLLFREDDNGNFYYFGINDKRQFCLFAYDRDWVTLIDWTDTAVIHATESNRITVIGQGAHFIFFINDQFVTDIMDDRLQAGTTALAIELANPDQQAVFEFDNIELRAP